MARVLRGARLSVPWASRFTWRLAASTAAFVALAAPAANAHFELEKPASWAEQDGSGNPQKSAPCGETDAANPMPNDMAVPTNLVTPFSPGETITITIRETIYHPGHYRVALAVSDRSELPADPQVTAGLTACGSAEIQSPPVFPVLADGMLQHTARFSGSKSFEVTLPTNVTCTKCTLQIIEFMSSHGLNNPGGCFYHHCADISIRAPGSGGSGGSGGASGGASSGAGGRGGAGSGGAGGSSSAGAPTVGGATSSGGVAGTVGKGGATSGGAAATSSGGSGTTSAGMPGAGASGTPTVASSDDEGGCALSSNPGRVGALAWFLPAALVVFRRLRRRAPSVQRNPPRATLK